MFTMLETAEDPVSEGIASQRPEGTVEEAPASHSSLTGRAPPWGTAPCPATKRTLPQALPVENCSCCCKWRKSGFQNEQD